MSRPTPFDHAFADLVDRFAEIASEAQAGGVDLADRARFSRLPPVQRLLGEVAEPALVEADPDAADEYLTTLYVAYRFWEAGRPVVEVSRERLETRLAEGPPGRVPLVEGARYLRLAPRWFWAQVAPATPHEPLDGMFVTSPGPGGEVVVLAVLGLRADREGFSQLTVRATPSDFRDAPAHVRAPAFEAVLEGGAAAGLRSVTSVAELLYLAQLALASATE